MSARRIALVGLALLAAPVLANYILPPTDARLLFVIDDWALTWQDAADAKGQPSVTLTFERGGKKESWRVDVFWLADRIDSNSICAGSHTAEMKEYVASVQGTQPRVPLLVEAVRVAGEKELFVAGLWRIEAEKAYANGCERGSWVLELKAEDVKACGSAEAYVNLIRDRCEPSWQKREELLKDAPALPGAQPEAPPGK